MSLLPDAVCWHEGMQLLPQHFQLQGLRAEALDDPSLSIMDGLGIAPRTTDTTARLRVALDDVDAIVKSRRPNRRRAAVAHRR